MDFTDAIYNWLSNFLEGGRQTSVYSGITNYVPFTPINNEVNYILVMPLSKTKQDTSTLSSLCDFIYQTFFNKTAINRHHQPLNLP